MKRIVIALGGNALAEQGKPATAEAQLEVVEKTAGYIADILDQENSFNLDLTNPGIEHPNGWPSKSSYPNRWLHSDMKDVSYFFNFKFYEKAIEKGGLR